MKNKASIMCTVRLEVKRVLVTYNLYADVILFNNFTMNFLLLTFLKKLMRLEKRKGGIFFASLGGALYALGVTIFPFRNQWFQGAVTYGVISMGMTATAFPIKNKREFINTIAGLYLTTAIIAGLLNLFHVSGGISWYIEQIIMRGGWKKIPFFIYIMAVGGCCFLTLFLWETVKGEGTRKGHLYDVTLFYKGKTKKLTAFLDTGNRLTEPFSKRPVSVVTAESCQELFQTVSSVLYVPYCSVGKKQGLLPAIKADRMEIEKEGSKTVIEKPVIAISKEPLSPDNTYQMLLNEKMCF